MEGPYFPLANLLEKLALNELVVLSKPVKQLCVFQEDLVFVVGFVCMSVQLTLEHVSFSLKNMISKILT